MTFGIDLQVITAACAVIACFCAVWVALRSSNWRETDAGKALVGRVDVLETKVGAFESKLEDKPSQAQFAGIEERIKGLATKAEIAAIQSDVHSLVREVGKVDAGVTRIEAFLMENGK